jgi:hypothetical protein
LSNLHFGIAERMSKEWACNDPDHAERNGAIIPTDLGSVYDQSRPHLPAIATWEALLDS